MDTLYKKGDKVRIKSEKWYDDNKDDLDQVVLKSSCEVFGKGHSRHCGSVVTIKKVYQEDLQPVYYDIEEDNRDLTWTNDMIECLVSHADTMVSLEKVCKYLKKYPSVDLEALKKYLTEN